MASNTIPVGDLATKDLTIQDLTSLAQIRRVADQEEIYFSSFQVPAKERYDNDIHALYRDYTGARPMHVKLGLDQKDLVYGSKMFCLVLLGFNKYTNQTYSGIAASASFETEKEMRQFLKINKPLLYCIYKMDTNPVNRLSKILPVFVCPGIDSKPVVSYIVRYHEEVKNLTWFKYHLQFILNKVPLNKWLFKFFYDTYMVK